MFSCTGKQPNILLFCLTSSNGAIPILTTHTSLNRPGRQLIWWRAFPTRPTTIAESDWHCLRQQRKNNQREGLREKIHALHLSGFEKKRSDVVLVCSLSLY